MAWEMQSFNRIEVAAEMNNFYYPIWHATYCHIAYFRSTSTYFYIKKHLEIFEVPKTVAFTNVYIKNIKINFILNQ